MTRLQQSSLRSCATGFSVFSSYSGGMAESGLAHVQQASCFVVDIEVVAGNDCERNLGLISVISL